MPIILPFSAFLFSLGSLILIISRRFRLIKKTYSLQKELETEQKRIDRMEKKEKVQKEKVVKAMKMAQEQKHQALRSLGVINDLLKKVDHDLTKGNDEEALKTLIQVIALDDHHRKGNELLANLYLKMAEFKKSELILKKIIELYPFDPEYHHLLGLSFFHRNQFKAATEAMEKSLSLDKHNPLRYQHLGEVFVARKEYKTALEFFVKSHRLDVRNIDLMFQIIDMCQENQDPISAREFLHKILDYEPYNQKAKSLLAEVLQSLQSETAAP